MATISDQGVIRAATTALCANGGFQVILRMPGLAVSGSDAEQLGLSTPQFQDIPVSPAVWRQIGVNTALVLGADSVATLLQIQGCASVEILFQTAVGIVVDGVLYVITNAEAMLAAGVPCAYRLAVQAPAWS